MVRSNPVSFGRVAQCEALETRNLFATVGVDSAFHGGKFTTQFYAGNDESADAVVTLKDGRVFVAGRSFNSKGDQFVVAAVFNKDGTLSKSFDGDGKLTLPAAVADKLYAVTDVNLLKDGNLLLSGYGYLVKLKTSGQVDTGFGTKGVVALPDGVEAFNVGDLDSDLVVRADGTIHYASYDSDYGVLRSAVLSTAGKFMSSLRRTIHTRGSLTVLDNNELVNFGSYSTQLVRLYKADLSIESKFGNGGVVDLYPTYSTWAKAQKPWTLSGNDGATTDVPVISGFGTNVTTDGYVFHGEVFATTPKQPHTTYKYGDYTDVNVYVSSSGKINRIAAGAFSGVTFKSTVYNPQPKDDGYPYDIGGVFTTTQNKQATFAAPDTDDDEHVYDYTSAGDGKYYLVGASFDLGTRVDSFLVARTAYIG